MFDYPYECSKWFGDLIRQRDRTITEEQIKTFEETLRGYLNECMHTSYNFYRIQSIRKGLNGLSKEQLEKLGLILKSFEDLNSNCDKMKKEKQFHF